MRLTPLAVFAMSLALWGGASGQVRVVDLNGRAVDPLHNSDAKAIVLLFTSVECPISNRYAPEVRRLHDTFASKGVRFWLVYPNPGDTPDAIRAHIEAFGYPMAAVRDPQQELVRLTKVTVTPEAAVFDRTGHLVYRGRIDDRYVDFGLERPSPTSRDLEDALTATIAGLRVPTPTTNAVGCFLVDMSTAQRPHRITFASDIAPVLSDRCGACHRPAGPAPFSLLTYSAVRQRATQITAVTKSRFMPPWKAEPESGEFIGQRRLTDAEIAMIQQWVDEGAPEGDPRKLPLQPQWTEGWQLGTPDLIVTFPQTYTLQAEGTDVFRVFVLPIPPEPPTSPELKFRPTRPAGTTRYVRGMEFRPGNPRVVHHANIRIDRTPASRQLDAEDPLPGYDGLLARSAVYPEGHFLGWTPGQLAPLVPKQLAWRLDPGTDLVVQLHMQPSGQREAVQPSIGLFFGDEVPLRTPAVIRLGDQGIEIPAGQRNYTISDSYVLPVDAEVLAVQPHAHYRAREIKGSAALPDGTTKWLIHIKDWDFRWQHVYRFVTPFGLPKGTTLNMQFTYDNSAENVRNPERPPARVRWGQRSKDEMGDLWVQVLTRDDRDLAILNRDVRRKMVGEDIVGYETMIGAHPDDAELHDDVALLYLELGRADEAVKHFISSVRLRPHSAAAHFNLGTALTVAGKFEAAIHEYEQALQIRPEYANAHNNLGETLAVLGRLDDAIHHYREALRVDPDHATARNNLSKVLRRRQDLEK